MLVSKLIHVVPQNWRAVEFTGQNMDRIIQLLGGLENMRIEYLEDEKCIKFSVHLPGYPSALVQCAEVGMWIAWQDDGEGKYERFVVCKKQIGENGKEYLVNHFGGMKWELTSSMEISNELTGVAQ